MGFYGTLSGTNPLLPDYANALPQARLNDGYVEIVYCQRAGGTGNIGADYTFGATSRAPSRFADDLSTGVWSSGTDLVGWRGWSESLPGGVQRVAVRLKRPVAQAKQCFLRLRVHSP